MARPSSAEAAKRMLALIALLEDEARVPLSRIADALGVPERIAEREIERLSCCGIDGYLMMPVFLDGDEVEVFNDLPGLTRPIRLSGDEVRALIAALSVAGIDDDDPLLLKLLDAAAVDPPSADEVAAVLRLDDADPRTADQLKALSLAIERGRVIRITHRSASTGEETERVVEPWRLLRWEGAFYLQGYCRRAGALRTFRVDGILDIEVLPERVPERAVLPEAVALDTSDMPRAHVRVDGGLGLADLHWPDAHVVDEDESGIVVEVPFGSPAWLARRIASLGGRAVALDPPRLVEAVLEVVRAETA